MQIREDTPGLFSRYTYISITTLQLLDQQPFSEQKVLSSFVWNSPHQKRIATKKAHIYGEQGTPANFVGHTNRFKRAMSACVCT